MGEYSSVSLVVPVLCRIVYINFFLTFEDEKMNYSRILFCGID